MGFLCVRVFCVYAYVCVCSFIDVLLQAYVCACWRSHPLTHIFNACTQNFSHHKFPLHAQVLEDLIEEDDSNPDVWHLLALAYYSGHQYEEATETLAKGQTLLTKLGVGQEEDIAVSMTDLAAAIAEAVQQQQAAGAQ